MVLVKDKGFYRSFISMLLLLAAQNVIILGVNLMDNVMVAAYTNPALADPALAGESALAGVAAVNQLQFVLQQVILGLGDALVTIASQYWGQRRREPIKDVAKGAYIVAAAFGLLFFMAASFFPRQLVSCFTDNADYIAEGVKYLSVIRFTYILFALTNITLALLRAVETVFIAFVVSVSTLILNCGINYLLINGHFGFPKLGVTGAAVGTLIARAAELLIVLGYLFFGDKKLKCRVSRVLKAKRAMLLDYFRHCRYFIIVSLVFGTATALQSVILGHMNDSAIAANSVSNSLFQILKVISVGASASAAVRIGKAVGQGDMEKIKAYSRTLQIIFVCIGALTSTLLFFLRGPVLSLYTNLTPETYDMANRFLLVLCFTGFGTAYEMPTLCGIVRGGGDSRFVFLNDLISIFGIVLPVSYLAAFRWHFPPEYVVLCLNADQVFKCGAAFFKANSYNWVKKLTR